MIACVLNYVGADCAHGYQYSIGVTIILASIY